jgi:hypothetical protein
MVPPDSHRLPLIPWYLGTLARESLCFHWQDFHLLWFAVPSDLTSTMIFYSLFWLQIELQTPRYTADTTVATLHIRRFGLIRFRSSLLTESLNYFLFLRVLRYFTSPRLLCPAYVFSREFSDITLRGLPHSEIAGSQIISIYPTLIAGSHVLHRLLMPRHPPYALCNLTKNYYWYTDWRHPPLTPDIRDTKYGANGWRCINYYIYF